MQRPLACRLRFRLIVKSTVRDAEMLIKDEIVDAQPSSTAPISRIFGAKCGGAVMRNIMSGSMVYVKYI